MSVREEILFMASTATFAVYVLFLHSVSGTYLSIRNADPLATLHVLSPIYGFMILTFVALCATTAFYGVSNRYLHIILLIETSVMLLFTPYYLSGFSRTTDSLYHAGVAKNLLEIESQHPVVFPFASYYEQYPGSYLLNYTVMSVSRIDLATYARLFYPCFAIVGVVLLCYVFLARLFTSKAALVGTLIVLLAPDPAPPEVHVSPNSLGILLVFVSLFLIITFSTRKARLLGVVVSCVLIIVHPISPLVLVLFVAAVYVTRFISRGGFRLPEVGLMAVIVLSGWFAWAMASARATETSVAESIYNIVTLRFASGIDLLGRKATNTAGYLFPQISLTGKLISYTYVLVPAIFLWGAIRGLHVLGLLKRPGSLFREVARGLGFGRLLMISAAFLCAVASVASVVSGIEIGERSFYLWNRTFFYCVLAASAFVGSSMFSADRQRIGRYSKAFVLCWLVLLAMTYPIVHAESEAYQSYPPSEGAGIVFLSSYVLMDGITISMFLPHQLAAYANVNLKFSYLYSDQHRAEFLSKLIGNDWIHLPDVMVFRGTEYFYLVAMYDKSFQNSTYRREVASIITISRFNKVYSDATFEIYTKN